MHLALRLWGLLLVASSASAAVHPPRQFFDTTYFRGSSISSDGRFVLLTSDLTGVRNVYRQPVAGGPPVALTRSTTHSIGAVSWFPADDRFLYSADGDGNELSHLYVVEPGREPRDLTPGAKTKAVFGRWSGDKRSFFVLTNERDARYFDLYRYSTADYRRELVFRNETGAMPAAVSPDGRWVALTTVLGNSDSDVYLWDAQAPQAPPKNLTAHTGKVNNTAFAFSPDSRELVFGTDAAGEFVHAWAYDLAAGTRTRVHGGDWDVLDVAFSDEGTYRAIYVNEEAVTKLYVTDLRTGKPLTLPGLPAGDISGVSFSPTGDRMALYVDTDAAPANLFVVETASGKTAQLTQALSPQIPPGDLVSATTVRFPSFDGLSIPGNLYRPEQSHRWRVPALVLAHGGPGGQCRRSYNALLQVLVNQGYAVIAVNNRGSTGYGKTFYQADYRRHGEADLQDLIAAKNHLKGLDWIDPDRIGIIGGSYGGFLVAAALAFTPTEFQAGVDLFGVTNWVRTLKNVPPWWAAFMKSLYDKMGHPDQDGERFHRISPLFHTQNIVRPLLVLQGETDPRVLRVESDEIVAALRARGVPVGYVIFPDEGHGFVKKTNQIAAAEACAAFLLEHL